MATSHGLKDSLIVCNGITLPHYQHHSHPAIERLFDIAHPWSSNVTIGTKAIYFHVVHLYYKMNCCVGILSRCVFGVAKWLGAIDSLHDGEENNVCKDRSWFMGSPFDLRWSIGVACDTHMMSQW